MEGGFEIDDSLDSVDLDDIGSCLAQHYQEGKLHYCHIPTKVPNCKMLACILHAPQEKLFTKGELLVAIYFWLPFFKDTLALAVPPCRIPS